MSRIVKIINESDEYFEWVVTVANPKDERNYQVIKLGKWLGYTGASYHVIGTRGGIYNQKYGSSKNVIVGYGRNSSVTISGYLEILPLKTEKPVKLQEVKVVPNLTNDIVSVGLLLEYRAEMEEKIGIMNVKYKRTRMKFRRSENIGYIYVLQRRVLRIRNREYKNLP